MRRADPSGLRSFLFAPGDHARRVAKALTCGADAVILDLEDAVVPAAAKEASARQSPKPCSAAHGGGLCASIPSRPPGAGTSRPPSDPGSMA
ncbi:MAG: hypothetical protein IPI06_09555 [Gammaproteobacteria bacterium]|nr:hypothetical protein [Gammaproteobacteria bacterium]